MSQESLVFDKGLPCNLDCERTVLGSLLINPGLFPEVAAALKPEDFSIEKHRRIYARMLDLAKRDETIDRLTVANELHRQGQLESIDGISYLLELDSGVPDLPNLDQWVRIVRAKADRRNAIFACQRAVNMLLSEENETADILGTLDGKLLDIRAGEDQRKSFKAAMQIIGDMGGMDEFFSPKSIAASVPTPWPGMNEMLTGGGFKPGQLVVFAGLPGAGKTAMATGIGTHAVKIGKRTYAASLEMDSGSFLMRAICAEAQVNFKVIGQRDAGPQQRHDLVNAVGAIGGDEENMLLIWDDPHVSIASLRAELRKESVKHKVGLLIVDYLQLIEEEGGRQNNRAQSLGDISRGLKMLGRELNCPVLVMSSVNRKAEEDGRRPQLSDLRDSGAIAFDADIAILLYTEKVATPPDVQEYEIIIAKQKNGPIGTLYFQFHRKYTRFRERGDVAA